MENKNKELIRTFLCVKISDEAIKEVARVQEVLEGWRFIGKMTELENLHLTLKFLGEISIEKVEEVRERMKEITFKEFEAKLSGIGVFSYKGKPRIVWIKIGGDGIFELQKRVDDKIKEVGFAEEERFMSHMTIARVKYTKDGVGFLKYVKGIGIKEAKWRVDRMYLMKSELTEQGLEYSVIEEVKSVGGEQAEER